MSRYVINGWTIPDTGCFWGADDDRGFTGSGGIETSTELNRRMAIRNRHFFWGAGGGSIPTATASDGSLTNPLVLQMVSWNSNGSGFPVVSKTSADGKTASSTNTGSVGGYSGMDRIANGEFDSALDHVINALKALTKPVIFRPWQEFDLAQMNSYVGYQGGWTGAGQTRVINAFRHLKARITALAATNIILCWCPSFYDPHGIKLGCYPGDAYVDVIGLDLYRHKFAVNVDDIYNFSVSHGKPFMIAEAGFQEGSLGDGLTKEQLIDETRNAIKGGSYDNTVAYVHWNSSGPGGSNYVDSSPSSLQHYRDWVTDPYFDIFIGSSGPVATAPSGGQPSLSDDTPAVGEQVTCDPGVWAGSSPITFAYNWRKLVSGTWTNCSGTGHATATYTVDSTDLGDDLKCVVTATNSAGSASASSETTAAVAAAPAVPYPNPGPSISPTTLVAVGGTITVSHGTWGNSPTSYAQKWQRQSGAGVVTDIAGATGTTYTVQTADVGFRIRAAVQATNGSGTSAWAYTTYTNQIPDPSGGGPPTNTSPPSLSDYTPVEGETLTCNHGGWVT